MQEKDIIELLLQRNEKGMDALLLHYGPLMRYIIAPILKNPQDQEDCLSEVTMCVWEKIGQFNRERGSWKAWLTSIARNCHQDIPEDIPSSEPTPEEVILQKERQSAVKNALCRLSAKDRMLFYRKYYYLQSTAQIASELGMTERAVEGRLYRMKKQLRKMLGGEAHE